MRLTRILVTSFLLLALVSCGGDSGGAEPSADHEMGEEEASDPEAVVADIRALLAQVVSTYEGGDAEAAGELAAEAYLENYEHIEDAIDEKDHELNEELEALLGTELREQIEQGVPASEIQQMVARAEELLAQAVTALEG